LFEDDVVLLNEAMYFACYLVCKVNLIILINQIYIESMYITMSFDIEAKGEY
jgi:hypothetical protein